MPAHCSGCDTTVTPLMQRATRREYDKWTDDQRYAFEYIFTMDLEWLTGDERGVCHDCMTKFTEMLDSRPQMVTAIIAISNAFRDACALRDTYAMPPPGDPFGYNLTQQVTHYLYDLLNKGDRVFRVLLRHDL